MLRQGLAVFAAIICGVLGISLALGLSRRARRLGVWRAALARLKGALLYAGFSLPAALLYAGQQDAPALLRLRDALLDDPAAPLKALWEKIPPDEALKAEDWRALDAPVAALSAKTLEEQCEGLELTLAALERLEDEARKKTEKTARLYMSGGCLTGALLLIILL